MANYIRWQQRFSNYNKTLIQLEAFSEPPALNEREQQSLIKAFEYTLELAWNTLRGLMCSQGNAALLGSLDTYRLGLTEAGETLILMIQDRNLTSHTHHQAKSDAIGCKF